MKAKLLLIPLIMLAAACSEENEDLTEWMQTTQKNAKSHLKPPTPPEMAEPAQYNPPAPINPHAFSVYRMRSAQPQINSGTPPDLRRPKQLLETVSLDKLKFVGTIGSGNHLSALINSANDNLVYTVNVGNYLGQNYGRIIKITPDAVTLSETVEDTNGNWEKRQVVMPLGETIPAQPQIKK